MINLIHRGWINCYNYQLEFMCNLIVCIVQGIPRKSKVSAKRLVALEACRRLYELNELDENFLPVGHKTNLASGEELFPHWDADYTKTNPKKSLKKKRQFFRKHVSFLLVCYMFIYLSRYPYNF